MKASHTISLRSSWNTSKSSFSTLNLQITGKFLPGGPQDAPIYDVRQLFSQLHFQTANDSGLFWISQQKSVCTCLCFVTLLLLCSFLVRSKLQTLLSIFFQRLQMGERGRLGDKKSPTQLSQRNLMIHPNPREEGCKGSGSIFCCKTSK